MAPKLTVEGLEGRAPSSLKHARTVLTNAVNSTQKKLAAIEKTFYGSKHTRAELAKKARLITKVGVGKLSYYSGGCIMSASTENCRYYSGPGGCIMSTGNCSYYSVAVLCQCKK